MAELRVEQYALPFFCHEKSFAKKFGLERKLRWNFS